MQVVTISPRELAAKKDRGEAVELIDVRTPVEFGEVHCSFAKNVPLSDLDPQAMRAAHATDAGKPLYFICRSGSRGKQACEKLLAAGFANVFNVDGGTLAWAEQGLPVARGKKAVALERQVRIAAGILILLGAGLGAFVHPYFIALAGFVGAGLVFSGVTDTCGMGLILARMPWNQAAKPTPSVTEPSSPASQPAAEDCCGATR